VAGLAVGAHVLCPATDLDPPTWTFPTGSTQPSCSRHWGAAAIAAAIDNRVRLGEAMDDHLLGCQQGPSTTLWRCAQSAATRA
jgi:hypothetical protein